MVKNTLVFLFDQYIRPIFVSILCLLLFMLSIAFLFLLKFICLYAVFTHYYAHLFIRYYCLCIAFIDSLIAFYHSFNLLIMQPGAFLAFFFLFDMYQVLDFLAKLLRYKHVALRLENTSR